MKTEWLWVRGWQTLQNWRVAELGPGYRETVVNSSRITAALPGSIKSFTTADVDIGSDSTASGKVVLTSTGGAKELGRSGSLGQGR